MTVKLEQLAEQDLVDAHRFYEDHESGVGDYFLSMIQPEIMNLAATAGSHRKRHGFHFCPSKRFPHGFYYLVSGDLVKVYAVLDSRRHPKTIRRILRSR